MELAVDTRFTINIGDKVACCLVTEILDEAEEGYHAVQAFSQNDPRWRADKLLHSNHTLGGAGCAITCAAMVLSQAYPDITPALLNEVLSRSTNEDNGLLLWEAIEDDYPRAIYEGPHIRHKDGLYVWHSRAADIDLLKEELVEGPVITEVDYRPGGEYDQHFVLALGLTEDEVDLHIIDPIDGQHCLLLDRYGALAPAAPWSLARAVYGLRLLRIKE